MDVFAKILEWYKKQSSPTEDRNHYVCPICDRAWSSEEWEWHAEDCWIGQLQAEQKERGTADVIT